MKALLTDHSFRKTLLRTLSLSTEKLAVIKKLRDLSLAPVGDVKNALEETQYDLDSAYQVLRKKGLAAAAKKASRLAVEGLVGVAASPQKAAIIEINCETDFVARNEVFCNFVQTAADALLSNCPTLDGANVASIPQTALLDLPIPSAATRLGDMAVEISASIREKIEVRRAYVVQTQTGQIFAYCHNKPPGYDQGLGKIAAVASLELQDETQLTPSIAETLKESQLGHQLAMHIAAAKPFYIDEATVDPHHLEREKQIQREQAAESGKPHHILEKIVEGRMKKFYEEVCLMNQKFIAADDTSVQTVLRNFSRDNNLSAPLSVAAFLRVHCGETIKN